VSAGAPPFFWLLIWGVLIAAAVCLAAVFLGRSCNAGFAWRRRAGGAGPPGVRIDRLDLTVPADPRVLRSIRQSLRRLASDLGLDGERSEALVVAVGEAVSNAIEHAYPEARGRIHLRARRVGAVLVVEVQDHGRWRQGATEEHRGHGLQLMRAFVDGVDIETTAVGTTVRLTLSLPRAV
jgi:anti-sigma regulatory factor (Ser/Thr protein kinase)